MSSKKNVIISGFIALAATLLIIVASMFAGIAPHQIQPTTTVATSITQSTSTSITAPSSSTTQTVTITTTVTTSPTQPTTSTTPSGKAILSILFTDPPRLAEGVKAVYINYSKIGIHYSRPNVGQGWVWTKSEGVNLNLTALDGVAQAIDSIEIESGTFVNLIRFNITGAKVEYNGRNYTAFVRTGNLTIKIIGGVNITEGVNALLVDVEPTVFNMGTSDEPFFVLTAVAKGYPVPLEEIEEIRDKINVPGFKFAIRNRMWWQRLRQMHASNIEITSAEISSKLLKVNVKNTGEGDVMLRLVIVFPLYIRMGGKIFPPYFEGAAVFLIKDDGTLQPAQLRYKQNMGEDVKSMLMISRGYKLAEGKSIELKYEGELVFDYGLRSRTSSPPIPVSEYLVAVIGDGVADTYIIKV